MSMSGCRRIGMWLAFASALAFIIALVGSMRWHVTVRVPAVFRVEVSAVAARISWCTDYGSAPHDGTQWDAGRFSRTPQEWWPRPYRRATVWPGFILPLWTPALMLMMLGGALWWPDRWWSPRNRAGHCRTCGYDRRGSKEGAACPECGQVGRWMRLIAGLFARGRRWRAACAAAYLGSCVAAQAATEIGAPPDVDSDGDGLPDFREIHKYGTDPKQADSDGDGVADSDPAERREHAYTVRAVMRILPPYDLEAMNDDFQDARLIQERPGEYAEVEVILYPFNACNKEIEANADWKLRGEALTAYLRPYLAPGITNNFDESMRASLMAALAKDGVEIEGLDDRETVVRAAKWLDHHARCEDGFTTFAVDFDDRGPFVPDDMKPRVGQDLAKSGRTLEQQWNRELFGKGMFETGVRGTCTSTAIYFSTAMRCLGVPTRTIICTPLVDASDPDERKLIEKLSNHRVRDIVERAAESMGDSWSSHTFNEVWVGGRWRRLNSDRLGQDILDRDVLGLMVHVNTFAEMSKAGLITWGRRDASGDRRTQDVFGHSNPYSCIELSDQFGAHAKVDNPPVPRLTTLTIERVEWFDKQRDADPVTMRGFNPNDGAGHLLLHAAAAPDVEADGRAIGAFYEQVGKRFVLRAAGHPDVPALAERGYWLRSDQGSPVLRAFYMRIDPKDFQAMAPGVGYALVAVDQTRTHQWKVNEGVMVERAAGTISSARDAAH